LETDYGVTGLDRRKAIDAQRSERKPTTPQVQSGENKGQAAFRNAGFSR
jgi:hypothetical protein